MGLFEVCCVIERVPMSIKPYIDRFEPVDEQDLFDLVHLQRAMTNR